MCFIQNHFGIEGNMKTKQKKSSNRPDHFRLDPSLVNVLFDWYRVTVSRYYLVLMQVVGT